MILDLSRERAGLDGVKMANWNISPLVALCTYRMFDEGKLFQDPVPIVQYVSRVPQDLEAHAPVRPVQHLEYFVCLLSSFWSTSVVAVALSLKPIMALYNQTL